VLELPETLRGELKEPLGEIYTDPDALLAAVDEHADTTATQTRRRPRHGC